MSTAEFASLKSDIARRGIVVPIEITRAGVVIDGRQRLLAARALELPDVPVRIISPVEDLVDYMLSAAIQRRSLTPSQRAALALELHEYRQHRDAAATRKRSNLRGSRADVASVPHRGRSRDHAATLVDVSPRLIQHAITVRNSDPDLFAKAKAGELPLQRAVSEIRRRERYAQIGNPTALPKGTFDLIYADPPWQLGNPDSAWSPEQHYPTQPVAEIKELAVPAADDAVLLLRAVSSRLPEALEVIAGWGFTYKTSLVWVKPWIGMGAWVRHRHELLLIGQRGKHPAPEPKRRPDSVIEASRGEHSEKPDQVYALIEHAYPQARKLELYARGRARQGWTAWGNEAKP